MNDKGYINIQGWQINHLGIKGNELILYALIYGFSQDGKSEFHGSYSYVQKALAIKSKKTIQRLFASLMEKGLIKRTKESHYIAIMPVVKMTTPPEKGVVKMTTEGSQKGGNTVVKMTTNNNTNNTYTNTTEQSSEKDKNINIQIGEIIKEFETVNPTCSTYYDNTTQRKASRNLIALYGFENVVKVIRVLPQSNNLLHITKITTPSQLLHNYAKLKGQLISLKEKKKSKGKAIISS